MAVSPVPPRILQFILEPTASGGGLDHACRCAEIPALAPDEMSVVIRQAAIQRQF